MKKIKIAIVNFLTPQPEIKEDYVDKVVYLLRRDFTTTEQNEIVISITKKLADLREQDMTRMSKEYELLQNDHLTLKQAILC